MCVVLGLQERLSDLVYLTADATEELSQLDSGKIYIIGGIVDRNRHKVRWLHTVHDAFVSFVDVV